MKSLRECLEDLLSLIWRRMSDAFCLLVSPSPQTGSTMSSRHRFDSTSGSTCVAVNTSYAYLRINLPLRGILGQDTRKTYLLNYQRQDLIEKFYTHFICRNFFLSQGRPRLPCRQRTGPINIESETPFPTRPNSRQRDFSHPKRFEPKESTVCLGTVRALGGPDEV